MLLDEPTSGLDANSAKLVISQLRQEADRGLSIVATIHQPSAELLWMFDKVIVLSEGRTIYHGAPDEIRSYFERAPFRYAMGLYCNPADKLMTLASHPKRCIQEQTQSDVESTGEQIALLKLEAACRDAVQ